MSTKSDQYTQTQKSPQLYSDFLSDLDPHPITGDLVKVRNESSVRLSLQNLLKTNYGERFFNPDVGSNIYRALFEPNDSVVEADLRNHILDTIKNNEPRVIVLDLSIETGKQKNLLTGALIPQDNDISIAITITFMIVNTLQPQTVTVTLNRVR